jgi:hypothetical protein
VISFDINWEMNFHYGIEEGTINSFAYCRFAEAGTFMIESKEILSIRFIREGLEKKGMICNDHELNIHTDQKDI